MGGVVAGLARVAGLVELHNPDAGGRAADPAFHFETQRGRILGPAAKHGHSLDQFVGRSFASASNRTKRAMSATPRPGPGVGVEGECCAVAFWAGAPR